MSATPRAPTRPPRVEPRWRGRWRDGWRNGPPCVLLVVVTVGVGIWLGAGRAGASAPEMRADPDGGETSTARDTAAWPAQPAWAAWPVSPVSAVSDDSLPTAENGPPGERSPDAWTDDRSAVS